MKRLLLLGHTGKMGLALAKTLAADYQLVGRNSADFDAANLEQVSELVRQQRPDLLINAIAFQGIDRCEAESQAAFRINTLLPGHLAQLAADLGITLVHFSTDAVFSDREFGCYSETDLPSPLNVYGVTKLGGEALVRSRCERHYIFRLPILFGESLKNEQFVEKMLQKIYSGATELGVADDIISSPSYALDIAGCIREMLSDAVDYGTYHLTNEGSASLFDLLEEIVSVMGFEVALTRAMSDDFPHVGRKNRYTPLSSGKLPILRPWRAAVGDYCSSVLKRQ